MENGNVCEYIDKTEKAEVRIPALSTCTENVSSDRVVVFCKIIE